MAKFKVELPNEIIKQMATLEKDTTKMLQEMTEAGAKVVESNIKMNVPHTWLGKSIMNCLKVTDPYYTPTDDGINTKVAFYGYFMNENNKKTPAPLVANVTEFGRSDNSYPKKPFMRKSFKKSQIQKAMLDIQKKYIKE